jgi:Domain of Unknown Function (DUF1080).
MINKFYSALITLMILFVAHDGAGQSAIAVKTKKGGKTQQLFNGRNLDGWYTFLKDRGKSNDPKKVFTVEDGMIRISGEDWGCITTNKEYENYTLTVEFKWGEKTWGSRADKARDCGLLIHSQGVDGGYSGVWMHSIEVQLIEGGTGDLLVVGDGTDKFSLTSPVAPEKQGGAHLYQPGGNLVTIKGGRINWYGRDAQWKDVKDFRGKKDVENPVGEWNTLVCIAERDSIKVYLNGTLVNEAMNLKPAKGRIQIQSEGAEVFVRKVQLVSLR